MSKRECDLKSEIKRRVKDLASDKLLNQSKSRYSSYTCTTESSMMETPIPDSYHPSRKPSSFRLSRQQSSLTFHTELIKKEEGPNQKNYSCDSCEIL